MPSWVNDGTARVSDPPAIARTAEEPDVAHVSDREPEPLVIVPAVQPDDSSTAVEGPDGVVTPTTAAAPARRQLQVPRRARVRRVTRVIRYVDPWGVFKVALVFNLVGSTTTLVAGVLLWNVAHATGTVDNVERFMESFGWESFEFRGGEIFHHAWIVGLFVVVGLTGLAVLVAATFNLVTDLVGGLRVTVLEEELVAVPARPWLRTTPAESLTPATRRTDDRAAVTGTDADPWSARDPDGG